MEIYYSKKSEIHGFGIFLKKKIDKNKLIGIGIYYNFLFIPVVTEKFGSLINHSKNPNCFLKFISEKKNYNVYSLKSIKKNEEITLNYNNLPWFCCGPDPNWDN